MSSDVAFFLRQNDVQYNQTQADGLPGDKTMEDNMKKGAAALLAAVVSLSMSTAMAASDRCVVVKSEENILTLECSKETSSFKPNMEVKIKTSSRAAVEGC